ncbi:MAG: hypothetical protein EOO38_23065 [Cytophagaceae bacterium]|nr:MAG: hypothetical protein EOO38_23065 [Cytophagaceae bacterium]
MSWNDEARLQRIALKNRLNIILEEDERSTRLKSKMSWAKDGDGNSKLFHSLMSARKAKNGIWKIERDDGSDSTRIGLLLAFCAAARPCGLLSERQEAASWLMWAVANT